MLQSGKVNTGAPAELLITAAATCDRNDTITVANEFTPRNNDQFHWVVTDRVVATPDQYGATATQQGAAAADCWVMQLFALGN